MPNIQDGNQLIKIDVFEKVGLGQGMNIGDLGCGNLGYFALASAKKVGKNGIVYAVDILKSALQSVENRIQQEGLDNIKTIWSNLEIYGATKIQEASLDIAFIHNVLFHAQEGDSMLREAARLLKNGGKLMIIDWRRVISPFGPPLDDRPLPETIKKLASGVGLQPVEEFSAGPYHFGLIFIK